jgi:dienelactone hydrolase
MRKLRWCQSVWFAVASILLSIHSVGIAQTLLPGTQRLTWEGDLAARMVEGIHAFLDQRTQEMEQERDRLWITSSGQEYLQLLQTRRQHFREIIGAVGPRVPFTALEVIASSEILAQVASGDGYKIFAVRWPVFEDVMAEGLLLQPDGPPVARIVALPDADWSPEMLVGLAPGVPSAAQFARRLAEKGCLVVVPVLMNRQDTWSGIAGIRMTNQPHREYLYRMAFEVGRHIIGYEVQMVQSLVDWFSREGGRQRATIGLVGYGEGGLLALYTAAVDSRIERTIVSGYFQSRQGVWKEPIYRDVWGLLREFGDAELAALIAPRKLIVEACRGPEISGPPKETAERRGAAPLGQLVSPTLDSTQKELERARPFFSHLNADARLKLVVSDGGNGPPGADVALDELLESAETPSDRPVKPASLNLRRDTDAESRLRRQFEQWVAHTQQLVGQSPQRRAELWSKADSSSPEGWRETTQVYRDKVWEDVIGRLPPPSLPSNPRSRLLYDEPKFRGYEVVLDVWPNVFACGILLVPKDIKTGERRPVVVCQHGLEGRPRDVADPNVDSPFYHRFATRLAEEGFVTFAPQNPYIGGDRFRLIQRKAHPLKLSLFSFILGQHQRLLEWLGNQPFVDSHRIGFYGLSYGGKTAMRVPPLLDGYALSICSADFNEWIWKTTSVDSRYSYLLTQEYDMAEFNLANVANYAELAMLMAPRPFMVERGHADGVAPDEWVAYEYAKVRRFYVAQMKLPDRTAIEFFDGPHSINGKGTFEFLRQHLAWPK